MKKLTRAVALAVTLALAITGCGGKHQPTPAPAPTCPQAADGHGALGACSPRAKLRLTAPHNLKTSGQQVADLSNNDPCYCGSSLRAQGYSGLIVKANQGTGFLDWTAVGMVNSARAAGLTVGAYDFDQDYTVTEAQVFVSQLHAAGIYPDSRNTFPAYFDVEYGNFSYWGLVAQINYVRSQGYRVGIYTGDWYWSPNAGCQFPGGLSSVWLSGYPFAPVPCGAYAYNLHQFTDSPFDRSVFIGGDYAGFVNAGPPSDPYAVFPKTNYRFGSHGQYRFNEYHAAKLHDQLKCRLPLRRDVCWRLDGEIRALQARLQFVAWNDYICRPASFGVQGCHWRKRRHPNYRPFDRGPRNRLLGRRLVNRNPTYL